MIWSFLYFLFPACTALFFGVGISQAIVVCDNLQDFSLTGIKSTMVVIASTILTYLFSNTILVPVGFSDFFPIVALFIFLSISTLIEVVIRITTKKSASEFTISFLSILLAVGEATSLPESIFISLACILSFYMLSFVVYMIKRRVLISNTAQSMTNTSLVLLTMAILMIVLFAINVSSLNPGVLQ